MEILNEEDDKIETQIEMQENGGKERLKNDPLEGVKGNGIDGLNEGTPSIESTSFVEEFGKIWNMGGIEVLKMKIRIGLFSYPMTLNFFWCILACWQS